jgi:hypothetical protein
MFGEIASGLGTDTRNAERVKKPPERCLPRKTSSTLEQARASGLA